MQAVAIPLGLRTFLRQQQLYVAIAVAIYAMFWAIGMPASFGVTLGYTLFLANFTMLIHERLNFLYCGRPWLSYWAIYLFLLFALTPPAVAAAVFVMYHAQRNTSLGFWQYLAAGWKFPFVATIVVGIATQLYMATRDRLEQRNRALQAEVANESSQRELQEQDLERAREIQLNLLPSASPRLRNRGFVGAGADCWRRLL